MLNSREEIYSILNKLNVPVDYNYPAVNHIDEEYPRISYTIADIEDFDYRDGKPTSCNISFTVQVFEKRVNGELKEIFTDVFNIMKEYGYKKTYFDNYFDVEDKLFISTYRFIKNFTY